MAPLPDTPCPVCDKAKLDPRSIAEHNLRASIAKEALYRGPNR